MRSASRRELVLVAHGRPAIFAVSTFVSPFYKRSLPPPPPLPLPSATLVISLANLEGEESFDASLLGSAEVVVQEMVCDDELVLVKG